MTEKSPESIKDWLVLHHCPGLGQVRLKNLFDVFDSPREILETILHNTGELKNIPASVTQFLKQPDWKKIDRDLEWKEKPGNFIIHINDLQYPKQLKESVGAPSILYVKGNIEALKTTQIAMVGSRNPSVNGSENAIQFAKSIASAGLTVTSGLAIGIDSAAHQGALLAKGHTIGVMGTGLNRVYPASNRKLAKDIIENNGALVSEFPLGTPPVAGNFPRRNRIISGLSVGTLVIEAAKRSGSLITARLALEQGREVFAVPGSIHNPLARGCHQLIRQGAKLVESFDDIIDELKNSIPNRLNSTIPDEPTLKETAQSTPELTTEEQRVLRQFGFDPIIFDELVEQTNLQPALLSPILLNLEIKQLICAEPGNRYTRLGHH